MRTELTIEESQRLIDVGVPSHLASDTAESAAIGEGIRGIQRVPPRKVFTLDDLLKIIPKKINYLDEGIYHALKIDWDGEYDVGHTGVWVKYVEMYPQNEDASLDVVDFFEDELIIALWKALIWVYSKGYNE